MRYALSGFAPILILGAASLSAASWSGRVNQGNLLLQQGRYAQAVEEYQASVPLASQPAQRGESLFSLGLAYQLVADFAASERCYKQALDLFRAERDYRKLALSLSGLGQTYRAEHRLDDALQNQRSALLALQRIGMDKTREAAFVLGAAGVILGELGRLNAARRSIEAAQAIFESTSGPDTPEFATNLNRLAVIASARKRFDESESLLTEALRIRRARFGPDHPLTANSLLTLSSVYLAERRYAEADAACRQALEVMRRFLPANHPILIAGAIELASIAHGRGEFAAAAAILRDALAGFDARPSTPTAEYVQLVSLYAKYLGDAGRKQESVRLRAEAREMEQQWSRTSQSRATVNISEWDAGGLR